MYIIKASALDFPRAILSPDLWVYSDPNDLPRLSPTLRYLVMGKVKDELQKFGLKLKSIHLYGGSAGYQWHPGTDIDTSVLVDWTGFEGDIEGIQEHFKLIEEVDYKGYPVHFFLKAPDDTVEVSEAIYDLLNDEWVLPPLVLPNNFDPEEFFAPLIKEAERKAQRIDLALGLLLRSLATYKSACKALDTARDEAAVMDRLSKEKAEITQIFEKLSQDFQTANERRNQLHETLREKLETDRKVARFERFQEPEIVWKYLDRAGYTDVLYKIYKIESAGKIDDFLKEMCKP